MGPKISIVTVCYNSINNIENTILSVLKQTYDNIEYIIIDGGSEDGTVAVIEKYSDRLSYWLSEKDNGIYDAMNKGINLATGEWINFRNCGDYFTSDRAVEDFFKDVVNKDVAVLHGDCYFINDWGYKLVKPQLSKFSWNKGVMPVNHPSTFVRLCVHKSHLFDLQYRSSADYDLIYRLMSEQYKFEYRPYALVTFDMLGFSSVNWDVSFYENQKIIGRDKTIIDRIWNKMVFIKLLFKYNYRALWSRYSFLKTIHKRKMLRQGWKPLPINVNV